MIPLFDLHCDTFSELYKTNQNINDNNLHISLKKAESFFPYVQFTAIWSDFRLSDDEAYCSFTENVSYIKKQSVLFSTDLRNLDKNTFILSVEDARILNGDLSRLDTLHSLGVKSLTLNWKGVSCIGGAWDTNVSLTAFGKSVVKAANKLGLIIDLSHSSIKSFYDALELLSGFKIPPIASHSNSYSVYNHKRNLTDDQFLALKDAESLVGISLASQHLSENASITDVLNHI